MKFRDEYLCTVTDFRIRDGLVVDEPIYLEHIKKCARCRDKLQRLQAKKGKAAQPQTTETRPAVSVSTRSADPKVWALPSRKERWKKQKKWVLMGSAAASLLLLLTGYAHSNNQGATTNHAQANPVITELDLEGLNGAERTILMTTAPGTSAIGTMYILKTDSPDEKKLIIDMQNLKPSSKHVYQVWKHQGDRVEPVGTFEPAEDGTAIFASRLPDYHSIEGISITQEKRHEQQPMGRDLLVAALSPTWNKQSFQNGQAEKSKTDNIGPDRLYWVKERNTKTQYTLPQKPSTINNSRSVKQQPTSKNQPSQQQPESNPSVQPKITPEVDLPVPKTGVDIKKSPSSSNGLLDAKVKLGDLKLGIKL